MKDKFKIRELSLLLIILLSYLNLNASKLNEKKPNILLFVGDDMTWFDCQPYGNLEVKTPNIQRLADEGVCFDNMFTTTAMCSPSRQQLYTGLYPVRSGAYPNHSRVYDGIKSFASYFNNLGYRTALIGKKHYGPEESYPLHYFGGRHHDGGRGNDIELDSIKDFVVQPNKNPFFLVVAQNQPHEPWNRGNIEAYNSEELNVPEYLIDCHDTRKKMARYYAEITYADSLLGVCLDFIDKAGISENTIVIFTSEQGSSFPFGKWTCYDLGLKTAFIVRWPGKIDAGIHKKALTQYVDVVPTLLELVEAPCLNIATGSTDRNDNEGFDGKSFADILLSESDIHRNYVFGVQTTRGIISGPEAYAIRSVRNDKFKLIWNINYQDKFQNMVTNSKNGIYKHWLDAAKKNTEIADRVMFYQKRPEFELYNLELDSYELNNLAELPEYEIVKEKMFSVLKKWMEQQGDSGHETEMNALHRQVSN